MKSVLETPLKSPAQNPSEKRAAIIRSALDAFFESGFARSRMEDIAARAGVSKGALYLHFKSKEELFEAVIETVALPNLDRIEKAARAAPGALAALDAIAAIAPTVVRDSDVPRILKVLVADARAFPDLAENYRRRVIDRILALIAGTLAAADAAGEIVVGDADLTARLVAAPMAFAALWRVVFSLDADASGRPALDVEALFRLHTDLLKKALAADVPGNTGKTP